jgi:triphosphoribosyl-dephospho-CoA synthase
MPSGRQNLESASVPICNDPMSIDTCALESTSRAGSASARQIRTAAVRALLEELVTYPKPGLVSLVDAGSHQDMDAATFVRSTLALRVYLMTAALAGRAGCGFAALRELGIEAEARMLRATHGVNTHRGAIFCLGLLSAAAGWQAATGGDVLRPARGELGDIVRQQWGRDIAAHVGDGASHGSRAGVLHGVGGARVEAAAGFPSVYRTALPAYRGVRAAGGSANQARVQAFFALLGTVDDTNLLHRGGANGLAHARAQAQRFLASGGVAQTDWRQQAVAVHRRFSAAGLSPGGCADLLGACVFVHGLEG